MTNKENIKKGNKANISDSFNVCIIDESSIFALGLKNTLKRNNQSNKPTCVFIYESIIDIVVDDSNPIDLLFIEYNLLLNQNFTSKFSLLKKSSPKIKLIVYANDLLTVDFVKLYSFNINGFFSTRLSVKSFISYLKKIMNQNVYIDHYSISQFVNVEKKQKLKSYYKSISLNNLEIIMNDLESQTMYNVDRGVLSSCM
jgi:DNA-binding NarL/FixJ family response regulator